MGKFLFAKGFKSLSVGILSCSGEAKINGLGLTNQDLLSIVNQLSALHHDYELKVSLVGGIPFCAIPKETDPNVNLCNICDAAIHQIVVGPDGNCRACVESPWTGGNILVDTLDDIWNSTPFEDIRMFRNVPSNCCSCKFVSACHGGCRASAFNSTGSVTGLDPLMPAEVPNDFILQNSKS
jgi:radical SAM protein with 4Fe4S-binding SPASM domain